MNRDERNWIRGYAYAAKDIAEMGKQGFARGKGNVKKQIRCEVLARLDFNIEDKAIFTPFADGYCDALLDAVN